LNRAEEIITRILSHYKRRWRPIQTDPFKSLIRIILSQNTSYQNESKAFEQLERDIGVNPQNMINAPIQQIAEAIRPAGMQNLRSRTLKEVAEAVSKRYGGDISTILRKPYAEARNELMELPGVGMKTADVLLMFDAGRAIVPVDRHIARIAKRLELVPEKATYEEIRLALEAATKPDRRVDAHVLLIQFGREICRAQRPRCASCFLNDLCPYP
jgi:endonuclease-3